MYDPNADLDFGEVVSASATRRPAASLTSQARTVTRSPSSVTASRPAVRAGVIPGAALGGLIAGPLGAIAGAALGHAATPTHPVAAQVSAHLQPQISEIRRAIVTAHLQGQATREHRSLNRRAAFQRQLLDKLSRIERVLMSPTFHHI